MERWKKGMPLTETDKKMLQSLCELAETLGRTPIKRECSFSCQLKNRFGPWNQVIEASGLPSLKDPKQQQLRVKARDKEISNKMV